MEWGRLRWRMRGAWLWPTLLVLTVLDGVLLYELPFYEEGPGTVAAGILIAGFANLAAVALVAPLLGRLLRRRRPDLPRVIADEYAGTALVWALAAAFVVGGLAHRPAVRAAQDDRNALFAAVQRYVAEQAPEHEPYLAQADEIKLADDFYRACVPGPRPRRYLCLFVETDQRPPGLRRDGDQVPNSAYRFP
jgi:4-amino-4-deoxy-L-arabinose transferase-like glycosyltransferase